MKSTRLIVLVLFAQFLAVLCSGQEISQPGWFQLSGRVADGLPKQPLNITRDPAASGRHRTKSLDPSQPVVAEAPSPEILALARGLENDPLRIFNYVHDHIRFVLYFGSKKGAALTLLEKSGNDFDQCALLVALLRAAGYSDASYQFGWMFIPYDNSDLSHRDLHHWLSLDLVNTNWLSTSNLLLNLVSQRGYPTYSMDSVSDALGIQRIWVTLPISGTTYYLDPSFKVTEPISGINVTTATGFASNTVMTTAAGTDTGNYATNLNESALRDKLRDYTTNLLAYIQANDPNASVQDILSGQYIVASTNTALPQSLLFTPYDFGGSLPVLNWSNEPTNIMSTLSITFAGTNHFWFIPQLQGQRLTLSFDTSGTAQLWQDDTNLAQHATSGGSRTNVVISINHPVGSWDLTHNSFIDTNYFDQTTTASYQRTNATYALIYAFEPDVGWLHERQAQLAAYRQRGLADTSVSVVGETLNVMGLTWMLEVAMTEQVLASQLRMLPQHYHLFGRMGQERSLGYYVDVYMALYEDLASTGYDTLSQENQVRAFELNTYFASALEHGIIEQQQSSNLVASSTVRVLQLANTNNQAVYLASSTNWTSGYNVRSHIINYDLSYLDSYINAGYMLLLPRNGSNSLAGTGTWAGSGFVAHYRSGVYVDMPMVIAGAYYGGYAEFPGSLADPGFVDLTAGAQPDAFNPAPTTQPTVTGADPVNMVDGAFQINANDLAVGGAEPRGLSFARHYSTNRRNNNLVGMAPGWIHNYYLNAADVSAFEAGLGGTTPAQMAPMIAAINTAIGVYNSSAPDPKNWMVTALIAKWGIDQLTKNGVSVALGNDTVQFTKQPNGAFTPPAGSTMTLLKTNSVYWLQARHGNTFKFNSSGLATNITDPYNQILTIAYQSSNWVSTVTDWKSRKLTFKYSGTPQRLTTVTNDGAGYAVNFAYSTTFSTQGDLTSVTDPEGKTSTFLLDTNHQITASIDALSQLVVSNLFDAFGRVNTQYTQGDANKMWQIFSSGFATVEKDPAGSRRLFFYDDKNRFIAFQDALGNVSQTVYDGQDHAVMTISALNEVNQFIFDGNHNLTATVDPLGYTNTLIYDTQFNLIQTTDPLNNSSHFGHNSQFSLTGSTNGAGDWFTLSYRADGTPSNRTDSAGTTIYAEDANGFLNVITYPGSLGSEGFLNNSFGDVLSHTNGRGFVTSMQYNMRRQLTNTVAPTNLTMSASFDAVGNTKTATDARNNTVTQLWTPTRKLASTTFPSTPQGTPLITNVYENRDWLQRTLNPLQQATMLGYDLAGRSFSLTDPVNRTTYFGVDADGRRTSTTNAALEVSQQLWSARGEPLLAVDAATNTVSRLFDGAGNNYALTNRNGKRWQFQFDKANRATNTITPLNRSFKKSFNDRGLVATTTQPSGNAATNNYDALKRLTNRADAVGSTVIKLDANGNPTNVTDNGQSLVRAFNAYDWMSSFQDANGNVIQFRQDQNGNVTNIVYPGPKNIYYYFDSLNRLTNIVDWASRKTYFTWDLANRLTSITRPNGTKRTLQYSAAGELTNIVEQTALGGPIAFYKEHFSDAGRMDWEFCAPLPHGYTPPSRTMTVDDDNRLATVNGTSVTNDADGNMIWGPLTNGTFSALSFNARNQLLTAGGLSYGYDPEGNRTSITNGTNIIRFVVNPGAALSQVVMRIKNGVTNYYVYGLGLLYEADDAGNTKTYHFDFRGSTIALTDGSGNITDRIEYSVYGMTSYRSGSTDTPFLYNGRYGVMSDANGLLFMRSRYYNPYICRFVNADPSGFAGGLNWYAFADGNPVSLLDPFGLGATEPGGTSWLGDVLRRIPLIGGLLGGAGDILTGIGNSLLGLPSLGQSGTLGVGLAQILNGIGNTVLSSLNLAGRAFNIPNTAIGIAWGAIGIPFGAHVTLGNNAIQFVNHPFMLGGDITLGNTISYNKDAGPGTFYNGTDTYGDHERQHTYQGMMTGPLYLPLNGLGGLISILQAPPGNLDPWHFNNFMENGPNSSPPRIWP